MNLITFLILEFVSATLMYILTQCMTLEITNCLRTNVMSCYECPNLFCIMQVGIVVRERFLNNPNGVLGL